MKVRSSRKVSEGVTAVIDAELKFKESMQPKLDMANIQRTKQFNEAKKIVEKWQKDGLKRRNYTILFKIYLLQNYNINMQYFEGSGLNIKTITHYKSMIKSISKGNSVWGMSRVADKRSYERLAEFIKELSNTIEPIKLFQTQYRGNIKESLSNMLPVEKAFILAPIESKIQIVKKDKKSRSCVRLDKKLLIENRHKTIPELMKLFPKSSRRTLENYKIYLLRLENDIKDKYIPEHIVNWWNEYMKTNKETKKEITNKLLPRRFTLMNTNTNEIQQETYSLEYAKGLKMGLTINSSEAPFQLVELIFNPIV